MIDWSDTLIGVRTYAVDVLIPANDVDGTILCVDRMDRVDRRDRNR